MRTYIRTLISLIREGMYLVKIWKDCGLSIIYLVLNTIPLPQLPNTLPFPYLFLDKRSWYLPIPVILWNLKRFYKYNQCAPATLRPGPTNPYPNTGYERLWRISRHLESIWVGGNMTRVGRYYHSIWIGGNSARNSRNHDGICISRSNPIFNGGYGDWHALRVAVSVGIRVRGRSALGARLRWCAIAAVSAWVCGGFRGVVGFGAGAALDGIVANAVSSKLFFGVF